MPQPQMPAMTNWRFEVDVEKIGWLTIDTPKGSVNTLSRLAITELDAAFVRLDDLVASGEVISRARIPASSRAPMSASSTRWPIPRSCRRR